jgi:dihydroneopterin triphosphate diphosphatase
MEIRFYVSCFVVRPAGNSHEFLQIRRAKGKYMAETWQLVCGGIEPHETAWQAALRELQEETTLTPVEFYQLDVINTFYLAKTDSIMHSPMFCAIVAADAKVQLNHEHTEFRWLPREAMESSIMWPGERTAMAELCREILADGPAKPHLQIEF